MSLPVSGEAASSEVTQPAGPIVRRVDWAPIPRVNLLPPEVAAGRQFRVVQRALAAAVVAAVLVGGGATWWAQTWLDEAQKGLDTVQARTAQLTAEKARFAEVPKINAEIDQAETLRESAMATHVLWYEYLSDLAQATPAEVTLDSMSAAVAGSALAGAPAAANDPLAPAGIGGITFAGSAERWPDVAVWLERMNAVPGFANSAISQGQQTEAGIEYSGSVTITPDALSHAYDRKRR